jgi:hypothetical protein
VARKIERNEVAYAERVALDWQCGELADGLLCYRSAQFFLAHEHWESVWLRLEEPEKSFLQALIQTTAAFHHFQSGNLVGAVSLLRRALRRLQLSPPSFGGIAVTLLHRDIHQWLQVLESDVPSVPPPFPQICPIDQREE